MEFLPVVQVIDAPVPQMGASIPAGSVIVQPLLEARVVEHVACVRVQQMVFPSSDVLTTSLQVSKDMTMLELDEVDEEAEDVDVEVGVLEMFDESIDRFEQSGFRSRRLYTTTWQDAAAMSSILIIILFLEQIVDAPVPQIMEIRGGADFSTVGEQNRVPVLSTRKKLLRWTQLAPARAHCRTIH